MMSKLPILSMILGAYGAVFRNIGTLMRAFTLPALALLVLSAIQDSMSAGFMKTALFWFIALPFTTLIAIACHRVVQLGPDSLNNPWSVYWTKRETAYFINLIILSIVLLLGSWIFGVIFLMSPETPFGISTPWLGMVLTYIAVAYIQGRFSMVLPVSAIGKNMFLSGSWYLTAGNGPRMTIILLIPLAVMFGITSMLRPALLQLPDIAGLLINLLVYVVSFAVEIAALSLCYQFLRDSANSSN